MVKIKRTRAPKMLTETNKAFKEAISGMTAKEAYGFYKKNRMTYKYNTDETKRVFKKMNAERCSFCTKYISDFNDEMTVEHIRIKKKYPQYIYQWGNLLCSCRTCNTKRNTKDYNKELYLDPTKTDNIEDFFWFNADGEIIPNPKLDESSRKKADYMIKLYALDRKSLVCKRRDFFNNLMEDEYYNLLKNKESYSQNIIFLSVFAYYSRRCIK